MEIKREHGDFDTVSISIRLLNASSEVENLILKSLAESYKIKLNPKAKEGRLILIKDLDEIHNHKTFFFLIRKNKSNIENVNFFLGLNTQYDMAGFTVPNNLLKLIKEIADTIDFSVINYG